MGIAVETPSSGPAGEAAVSWSRVAVARCKKLLPGIATARPGQHCIHSTLQPGAAAELGSAAGRLGRHPPAFLSAAAAAKAAPPNSAVQPCRLVILQCCRPGNTSIVAAGVGSSLCNHVPYSDIGPGSAGAGYCSILWCEVASRPSSLFDWWPCPVIYGYQRIDGLGKLGLQSGARRSRHRCRLIKQPPARITHYTFHRMFQASDYHVPSVV